MHNNLVVVIATLADWNQSNLTQFNKFKKCSSRKLTISNISWHKYGSSSYSSSIFVALCSSLSFFLNSYIVFFKWLLQDRSETPVANVLQGMPLSDCLLLYGSIFSISLRRHKSCWLDQMNKFLLNGMKNIKVNRWHYQNMQESL